MAQMFGQLQRLSQKLVNHQQMSQQSLEMQRQQSQVQMETSQTLAQHVAKTSYDTRDFLTKAFANFKIFKGDEKAWLDWRNKFRVEASRNFRQAAPILDWAEDMSDEPISESDIQRGCCEGDLGTCSSMMIWFLSWKSFEIVRNTRTEVGLDG